MSKYFISNKYIYIYICLFHFVTNEEKLLLRYDDGEQKKEWEFKLDLETEGGQTFYNRLQDNKKIELIIELYSNCLRWAADSDNNFFSFLKTSPTEVPSFGVGDMVAGINEFIIVITNFQFGKKQKIGCLIEDLSYDSLLNLAKYNNETNKKLINLELVLKEDEIKKPDTTKIAEINKKIIIIFIIGLSILIIIFIIKFIF